MPENNRVYTISEVAELLEKHPQTIRLWIKKGLLPALKAGSKGQFMIKAEVLECLNYKPKIKGRTD